MALNQLSCQVAVDGTMLSCPTKIVLGKQDNELVFCGVLQWGSKKLSDALEVMDDSMRNLTSGYVDALLPDRFPGELTVTYEKKCLVLGVRDSDVCFKLAKAENGAALLFAFSLDNRKDDEKEASVLVQALDSAAEFFGIKQFYFYAQSGTAWMLPQLKSNEIAFEQIPSEIKNCSFMTYAHIRMEGDSVFVKAVRTLFGMTETDLFVGAGKGAFLCMFRIPDFKTTFMESKELYMMMETGKTPSFLLKGSFQFSFVPQMTFTVDCRVGTHSFGIEALAHTDTPVPVWGPFAIGDTCLMIQVSTGLRFGMYTNLFINKLQLFGALMLQVEGSAVKPELLSAAVSDLSIPILLDNLAGTHINGIEVLGFIKILGLPFQDMNTFSKEIIQNKDTGAIVSQFNANVTDSSLQLSADEVQLTPYQGGMNVSDLKRMRQYYIDGSGKLELMAQFYYATVNTRLGNYTIEPGLFICGVIEIFGKRFEVLFSYRQNDGLLAYAKIPKIDLKFIQIGPSQFSKSGTQILPIAQDSVMHQFLNPSQEGMVFFLTASKNNVSFYFDGSVTVLSLFSADARIIFCKGLISIDLRVVWLSILQVSLHLSVEYANFTSGHFEFCLMIDTSRLTEKLTAVTESIDRAIGRLRNKIGDATREIDRAQAHVDELYSQIQSFDWKIEQCRQAIRNASWWSKAFVAIGKGIEIGAYEVAKAGIYAAIGVATAALQVAKKVVQLSGVVGEAVMRAVQGVIQGAMSLFYINYIRLSAQANSGSAGFEAEIQFVALGKTYTKKSTIQTNALRQSPSDAFSREINEEMRYDLDHIEDGAFKSNWKRYRHENYTAEQHCKRLEQAKQHINSSVSMMTSMQNTYVKEFQVPMEEFDEMNTSLMDAFDDVENVLSTGAQAGDVSALSSAMGGLKRSVSNKEKQGVFRDGEWNETKEVIAQYDEAKVLYDKVISGIGNVQKKREQLASHHEALNAAAKDNQTDCMTNEIGGDKIKVLRRVEKQLYENFPVDRNGTDFINLSREPLIQEYFEQAEQELGAIPSEKLQAMRSRSRKGSYKRRL